MSCLKQNKKTLTEIEIGSVGNSLGFYPVAMRDPKDHPLSQHITVSNLSLSHRAFLTTVCG